MESPEPIEPSFSPFRAHIKRFEKTYGALVLAIIILSFTLYVQIFVPPRAFTSPTLVMVPAGSGITETAHLLQSARVIDSPVLFRLLVSSVSTHGVVAGRYVFENPPSLLSVAKILIKGPAPVKVTFPEGVTARDIAEIIAAQIPGFDHDAFLSLAKPREGYLFPDTYLFSSLATSSEIIAKMESTFEIRFKTLGQEVQTSSHSISDIVTMASLVEREANTLEDRKMIAGILWNRIAKKMPLQVDAVFGYIKGQDTYHPSLDDLAIKSPYNTYLHAGLPPTPISNPGLESLKAAVTPTKTDYLYYLTDKNGVMHYAKTFDAHKANRTKYLQ
jgi:UPF0755 protein